MLGCTFLISNIEFQTGGFGLTLPCLEQMSIRYHSIQGHLFGNYLGVLNRSDCDSKL